MGFWYTIGTDWLRDLSILWDLCWLIQVWRISLWLPTKSISTLSKLLASLNSMKSFTRTYSKRLFFNNLRILWTIKTFTICMRESDLCRITWKTKPTVCLSFWPAREVIKDYNPTWKTNNSKPEKSSKVNENLKLDFEYFSQLTMII